MIVRWLKSGSDLIGKDAQSEELLQYAECLHAQMALHLSDAATLSASVATLGQQLSNNYSAEDIVRYDPPRHVATAGVPMQPYCLLCGVYKIAAGNCDRCQLLLRQEIDFEDLTACLVWTSVLRDIKIDLAVGMRDVLVLLKRLRPYRSIDTCGATCYLHQCYFITHLVFVLTRWGATRMVPLTNFVEEYLFLLANMDVVICWKDPELVGEFVHALHIMGAPDDHAAIQRGRHYLIESEGRSVKSDVRSGCWVKHSLSYSNK